METTVNYDELKKGIQSEPDLGIIPPRFLKVTAFTTFDAEYAVIEDDLVFHFFRSPEVRGRPDSDRYWHESFPAALDQQAQSYFKADQSRLSAAYTQEVDSWWLKAKGFRAVAEGTGLASLDPEASVGTFVARFFEILDQALETTKIK